MNIEQAKAQFGPAVRLPRVNEDGLVLSGDRIFFTLQGEGVSLGCPAVFVRLHMCNLSCDWRGSGGELCDAWYTWKKDTKEYWTEHELFSFEQLLEEILKYKCNRVVFTGGEPLMQQPALLYFIRGYLISHPSPGPHKFWIVEFETNGTIMPLPLLLPPFIPEGNLYIQYNCSPKLASSGMAKELRIRPAVLKVLNAYGSTHFKFVATSVEDLKEVDEIVGECDLDPASIMIMPEGITTEVLSRRMQELANAVRDRGWRLSPRLQIYLWGNKRGT